MPLFLRPIKVINKPIPTGTAFIIHLGIPSNKASLSDTLHHFLPTGITDNKKNTIPLQSMINIPLP